MPTKLYQKIYYGAPGTGKSFAVNELIIKDNGLEGISDKEFNELPFVFRTTIYPEYSYSDFVGSVMPVVKRDVITYSFSSGIFTRALNYALKNPEEMTYLVIEEMSRGNVAAIFGDLFQLLDRNADGMSTYYINNELIAKKLSRAIEMVNLSLKDGATDTSIKKIFLPNNFSIIGTVNTSDQNVFVMDTAFKRRFDFEYVSIDPVYQKDGTCFNDFIFRLGKRQVSWIDFYQELNNFIVNEAQLDEDKQIGQFFIQGKLGYNEESIDENTFSVKNKLLQYLWEDVNDVIIGGESIFTEKIKSFSQLYKLFEQVNVFNESIGIKSVEERIGSYMALDLENNYEDE